MNAMVRFFEQLSEGTLVLTPNNRLSRFVRSQHGIYQQALGVNAWHSLKCMSLNVWLESLWESLTLNPNAIALIHSSPRHNRKAKSHSLPTLLSPTQEALLWQKIVASNVGDIELFNPNAAADVARSAWNTLNQWQVDVANESEIHEAFIAWSKEYNKQCEKGSLVDFTSMVEYLIQAVEQDVIRLPRSIVMLAFDDVPPQLDQLMETANSQGVNVSYTDLAKEHTQVRYVGLNNYDAELYSAARWAAGIVSATPEVKVGIVVPELANSRAQVERIFHQIFEPQYVLPEQPRHAPGFNISAAVPLANVPPVAVALLVLRLNFSPLNIEEVNLLLHSPFLGKAAEGPIKAQLESHIREYDLELSLAKLIARVGKFGLSKQELKDKKTDDKEGTSPLLPYFHQSLHAFNQLRMKAPKTQSPTAWAKFFSSQLVALGWPGERPLDTLEYQQLDIWRNVIAKMSTCDYMAKQIDIVSALDMLAKLAFDTPFQAQTSDSPVQVLGIFEAAGMLFDHLWVMGMDNSVWPAPVKPNPLLPLSLQRTKQMPRASAARELLLARRLTERFAVSADQVIFSYAKLDGDKNLQPSSLLEQYTPMDIGELNLAEKPDYYQYIMQSSALEEFIDTIGTPLYDALGQEREDGSKVNIRGGTQILKDQAACPFRAYAKHRLLARDSQQAEPGLNPADRGSLIHDALERIWKRLKDQAQLLSMEEPLLVNLIDDAISSSIKSLQGKKTIGLRLSELEHLRMHRLLRAWLELEKQRAPFSVVFSEAKQDISLAGMPVNIRYDRVDQLDDGSLFIIDYKTGKSEPRKWAGERPDEPQVPIYGVANQSQVAGVAFGQIHIDEVAFKGIAERDDIAPGLRSPEYLGAMELPDSWSGIIDHWRDVLHGLTQEFLAGEASVQPKQGSITCQYCTLQSLCRIKELEFRQAEEANSDRHSEGDL